MLPSSAEYIFCRDGYASSIDCLASLRSSSTSSPATRSHSPPLMHRSLPSDSHESASKQPSTCLSGYRAFLQKYEPCQMVVLSAGHPRPLPDNMYLLPSKFCYLFHVVASCNYVNLFILQAFNCPIHINDIIPLAIALGINVLRLDCIIHLLGKWTVAQYAILQPDHKSFRFSLGDL